MVWNEYNFSQQSNIFSSDDKNSSRNVSILFTNVYSLNSAVKNQICKLVDTTQISYESSSVTKNYDNFF